jgi:DNA primase
LPDFPDGEEKLPEVSGDESGRVADLNRKNAGGGKVPDNDPQPQSGSESGDSTSGESRQRTSDETAKAAGLILKRLERDLDRGQVDQKLLQKLGWSEDELRSFVERMQKQLQDRTISEQEAREQSLQQQSFEEMLRSLSLKKVAHDRTGTAARDRSQQETTTRRTLPPEKLRDRWSTYQRSISGSGTNQKPQP